VLRVTEGGNHKKKNDSSQLRSESVSSPLQSLEGLGYECRVSWTEAWRGSRLSGVCPERARTYTDSQKKANRTRGKIGQNGSASLRLGRGNDTQKPEPWGKR